MEWLCTRNRDKLYDALAAGLVPAFVAAFEEESAMVGLRWRVPSGSTPGTAYFVEDVTYWDGNRRTRCNCPYGQAKGEFCGLGAALPCKHALLVWFYSLPPLAREAIKQRDKGIAIALVTGGRARDARYTEDR